ncbi:MAG: hypothetical protein DDT26_00240 [Dehalococcoidia bacterium]|nr:hypothetical protein [Chloroflexota bacterium]
MSLSSLPTTQVSTTSTENYEQRPTTREGYLDYLVDQLGLVAIIAIATFWKFALQPSIERVVRSVNLSNTHNLAINGHLWALLERLKCDRVLLCQFHNGSEFSTGHHPHYVTCDNEVLRAGVASYRDSVQRLSTSRITEEIEVLRSGEVQRFLRDQKPKRCADYLRSIGVESVIEVMIMDGRGEPIAILVCHYMHQFPPSDADIEDILIALRVLLQRPNAAKLWLEAVMGGWRRR